VLAVAASALALCVLLAVPLPGMRSASLSPMNVTYGMRQALGSFGFFFVKLFIICYL
jgi:hypothetical protein